MAEPPYLALLPLLERKKIKTGVWEPKRKLRKKFFSFLKQGTVFPLNTALGGVSFFRV